MSVQVAIPIEKIESSPSVAAALSALLEALGPGRSGSDGKARTRRARGPSPETAAAPRRGRKAVRKAPARENAAQELFELIRKRGPISSGQVMKALKIKDPRALGGMIGSSARWASTRPGPRIETKIDKKGRKLYVLSGA